MMLDTPIAHRDSFEKMAAAFLEHSSFHPTPLLLFRWGPCPLPGNASPGLRANSGFPLEPFGQTPSDLPSTPPQVHDSSFMTCPPNPRTFTFQFIIMVELFFKVFPFSAKKMSHFS